MNFSLCLHSLTLALRPEEVAKSVYSLRSSDPRAFGLIKCIPGEIYGLVHSFIWYGQLSAKEYPMIYEPGCTMTHRVFFSTDYQGPIWIRVELFYKREYCSRRL